MSKLLNSNIPLTNKSLQLFGCSSDESSLGGDLNNYTSPIIGTLFGSITNGPIAEGASSTFIVISNPWLNDTGVQIFIMYSYGEYSGKIYYRTFWGYVGAKKFEPWMEVTTTAV